MDKNNAIDNVGLFAQNIAVLGEISNEIKKIGLNLCLNYVIVFIFPPGKLSSNFGPHERFPGRLFKELVW